MPPPLKDAPAYILAKLNGCPMKFDIYASVYVYIDSKR